MRPRVLLVDDDALQLESLRDLFADAGFVTQSAQSGQGALVMLEQFAGVMYIGLVVSRLVGLTMLRRM